MKKLYLLPLLFLLLSANFRPNNIHETDPGKFYRSGQLTGEEFVKLITKEKIKTVINLRGENLKEEWYQEELKASVVTGAQHFDVNMSADRLPHKSSLQKLITLYKTAERPILIHCLAGADRTGEAAAIYEMMFMGKSKADALKQLSILYYHVALSKPAKRYFIRDVWQGEDWAMNKYDPCETVYPYYDQAKFCGTGEWTETGDGE